MNYDVFIQQYGRQLIYLLIAGFILLFGVFYVTLLDRVGRTEVTFTTVPSDATIEVNGQTSKDPNIYVSPGRYTVTASREGFKDTTKDIKVTDREVEIGIALDGDSDIATKYYEDNPDEIALFDGIGGLESFRTSLALERDYPITTLLPYTDPNLLYAISYEISSLNPLDITILIKNSSTSGRKSAVEWIQSKGYDISSLIISYDDYVSPLTNRISSERGY